MRPQSSGGNLHGVEVAAPCGNPSSDWKDAESWVGHTLKGEEVIFVVVHTAVIPSGCC